MIWALILYLCSMAGLVGISIYMERQFTKTVQETVRKMDLWLDQYEKNMGDANGGSRGKEEI